MRTTAPGAICAGKWAGKAEGRGYLGWLEAAVLFSRFCWPCKFSLLGGSGAV